MYLFKNRSVFSFVSVLCAGALMFLFGGCDTAGSDNDDRLKAPFPCKNGKANNVYDCENVDLFAVVTPAQLGGTELADIWGWTDEQTGKEYALVALTDGVSFVDISDPANPAVIGKLNESDVSDKYKRLPKSEYPACNVGIGSDSRYKSRNIEQQSVWRDLKVFNNHLYVVSDGQAHGMQVFDLTRLRDYDGSTMQTFTEDVLYDKFANAHNIVINEETGFAYAVGITQAETCGSRDGSGLHMIDINDPKNPTYAGCYIDGSPGNYRIAPGYIHDAQCVNYNGPDSDYTGQEVCFNSAEGNVVITDVTDKSNPVTLGFNRVSDMYYSHQGWLTEDQKYFIMNDELDELNLGRNTKTYVWDVQDLDNPTFVGHYTNDTYSIDHNLYVRGNYAYMANYTSGLRVTDVRGAANANLQEVAHFDTQPGGTNENSTNDAYFDGAWSNYPYFDRDIVVVSDISHGLYILRTNLDD